MIKRIILGLTIFLLSLSSPVLAAGPNVGVIQGQVANGTPGGGSIAGKTVTLETYVNDAATANTTAQLGADGKFSFSGLSTADGNGYDVKVTYQGVDYVSPKLTLADNDTSQSANVTIYEPTSSDSAISITAAHSLIYLAQQTLQVVEYLVFTNSSNVTYVGTGDVTSTGGKRTLKLPLPADATNLQYGGDLNPDNIVPDTNGVVDTTAIPPGDKLVAYGYEVNYDTTTNSYKFSQAFAYPIVSYNFLVQGENTTAISSQLTAGQVVDFQGLKFVSLSGNDIAAGETINVQLSDLNQAGTSSGTSRQTIILVIVAIIVVLVGGGGFVYFMKKRNPQPVSVTDGGPEQVRRRLMVEIARLDDDFESGKIEEANYTKLRAEKKAQLVGLIQSSQEESGKG